MGLLCHASCGGSTRVTVSLARALAARGHAVHLFSLARPMLVREVPDGLSLHHPSGSAPRAPDRLYTGWSPSELGELSERIAGVVRGEGLDVLHFHYAVPFAFVAVEVRRRLGARAPGLVGTLHGTDVSVYGLDPVVGPQLATALEGLDALTTVSASHAELALGTLGLPRPPAVVPNFVDLAQWAPGRAAGVDGRPPRILHASNFRPVKNPQAVARVVAVRARHDARLWFVGDGEEMPRVRAILADAGRGRDVSYFGLRSDVERILPRSDLLLMTSRAESFCLAVLEAMACGVPVVAPRVGGIPEVVEDGRSGLLFEVDDDAAAARAVGALLGDRRRAAEMAREGVRRAALFSADAVVPRYESLYRRVVDRSAPLPPARLPSRWRRPVRKEGRERA